jgi:hypothetical protein
MNAVKPFGNAHTSTILIIGHDPRLQYSQAQAQVAFFLDYLARPRPSSASEARKCDLARALWGYMQGLTGGTLPLGDLYVTNLCNEFLEHVPGSGTVLIPRDKARRGVEEIADAVACGTFHVILPMAVQRFYYLCSLGFIDEDTEQVRRFVEGARPQAAKAAQGIYQQSGKAPFLSVCGQRFHHQGVPVVPIVHVKQWPLTSRMARYIEPMQDARRRIRVALSTE